MSRVPLIGRLSIARSLRIALISLTLVLAAVTAFGVVSLYNARLRYESAISRDSELATAAANLQSAGVAEEQAMLAPRASPARSAEGQLQRTFAAAALAALKLAQDDPASAELVRRQVAAQRRARQLAARGEVAAATSLNGPLAQVRHAATGLQARQQARDSAARARAHSDSRRAIIVVAAAGLLALLATLLLITALVGAMRRPLDELLRATRGLAAGELERRVVPAGPRELQDLGTAFNAMGEELANAQHRIEEERRRLAVTIESLGDALIVTEPDSSRILAVNPRAGELVPGLHVGELADGPESPLPTLEAALRAETIVAHRGRALSVTAAPLGSEADGVVWTVRDMSDRARLEQAKSDFVATASHELRSPLTSIKGFVELLEHSSENLTDRQREFIEIILRSTDRLVDLVNDLLDVARIEADRVEINRRPIDVGEAVREVAELMGPRIAAKHQHLGVYVNSAVPLALADPGRIRQIVANLLTNAHLYTQDGGRIQLTVEADRAWVGITVRDSGVGMNEEELERIFERFYRASPRPSDGRGSGRPSGTGLGLSIVKSLVDMHHGRIDVVSEPGVGTEFRVLFPVAVTPVDRGHAQAAIGGRRVLVLDDEPEIAELIARQLASYEVQTTIAGNAEEALERLRSERYDGMTLDILLPGSDGLQLLAEIRGDSNLSTMPIVVVSVVSARDELAGEWTVSKPIDSDRLRDVLTAALRSGPSRVLVVGRLGLQPLLEPELVELGIEHQWELSGAAGARVCRERRFEATLVDVGVRNPQAVLRELDARDPARKVILFSDGVTPTPTGLERSGIDIVPIEQAAPALLAALHAGRDE